MQTGNRDFLRRIPNSKGSKTLVPATASKNQRKIIRFLENFPFSRNQSKRWTKFRVKTTADVWPKTKTKRYLFQVRVLFLKIYEFSFYFYFSVFVFLIFSLKNSQRSMFYHLRLNWEKVFIWCGLQWETSVTKSNFFVLFIFTEKSTSYHSNEWRQSARFKICFTTEINQMDS